MTPGQHSLEPFSPNRSLGALRDTIYIILPGPKVTPFALHRRDIEGTVHETVLKYGHGGLNIDGCRIKHANPEDLARHKSMVDRLKAHGGSLGDSWKNTSDLSGASEVSTAGRWPPNVLLVHGPHCRQIGSESRSMQLIDPTAKTTPSLFGAMGGSVCIGSATEEVPIWDCQPDCPVRILDEQTGDRPGMPLTTARQGTSPKGYGGALGADDASMSPGFGDQGGASRFFPQFKDLEEAQRWLRKLIGDEP